MNTDVIDISILSSIQLNTMEFFLEMHDFAMPQYIYIYIYHMYGLYCTDLIFTIKLMRLFTWDKERQVSADIPTSCVVLQPM